VGLAPFYQNESLLPEAERQALLRLEAAIAAGQLATMP